VQKPLGDLTDPITERVGDSDCIPFTVTTGEGLISQDEKYGRTIAGNSVKNYYRLQRNDFAFNKSATKVFPQGYIARFRGDERAAVPNSIFTCFRIAVENVDAAFLDYLFQGNLHGRWLKDYITVGARAHGALNISDDDLFALPVPLPAGDETLAEQRKIAECLGSLDDLIAAEGRKLAALRDHKQGLMQQLFPREGETQPRLRFPEFRDAWDECTLGALSASISSGRDKSSPDGAFDLYGSTGVIGKSADGSFVGTFLLVARVGANAGLLTKVSGSFGVTDNTLVIDLKDKKNNSFVFHYLDSLGLNRMVFGSGQPLITGSQLKTLPIMLPKRSEREKVADCLSALDARIAGQAARLDALRTHKCGLMQQLFPNPEAR